MPVPVRISIQAESDLLIHFCYIARDRPATAERLLDSVQRACARISEHPQIGEACEGLAPKLLGLRHWPVPGFPSYLIFYRVTPSQIQILRLLHGARDLGAVLTTERITFEGETAS